MPTQHDLDVGTETKPVTRTSQVGHRKSVGGHRYTLKKLLG